MHCKKTTFNVINRKVCTCWKEWKNLLFNVSLQHHCRNCGQIVCGACSKNTHLMLNISSKPVRVCDGCYEQLSVKPPNNTQSNNNGADTSDSDGEGLHSKDSNYRESGRSLEDLDDLREKVCSLTMSIFANTKCNLFPIANVLFWNQGDNHRSNSALVIPNPNHSFIAQILNLALYTPSQR